MTERRIHFRPFGYSKIYIVESLAGECHTGKRLFESLEYQAQEIGVALEYLFAHGRQGLVQILEHITDEARELGAGPILHFEVHGEDGGMQLASGEVVPWKEISPDLARINYYCKNNLLVTLFVCEGESLFSIALDHILGRSPFWMLIASPDKISTAQSEAGWQEFYSNLLRGREGTAAFERLNDWAQRSSNRYSICAAEAVFRHVWHEVLTKRCSASERQSRSEDVLTNVGECWPGADFPLKRMRKYIKGSLTKERHVEFCKNAHERFFMIDLYPENRSRFPLMLEGVTQRNTTKQSMVSMAQSPIER